MVNASINRGICGNVKKGVETGSVLSHQTYGA